ncbi:MAG: hypothetical protein PHR35_06870, partial [Kiritimatiellae bacterium]|nr:hypothetical protein [Kiritimatiellia bacterium]
KGTSACMWNRCHKRLHTDAWVYSEFLPIDVGMASPEDAAQALYFTEWGLERIRLPFGGVLCQPSNWVPWKWSVRDMFGGDLFHLALAYCRTGLGDDGWDIMQGALLESAFAGAVPGGLSHIGAGTDFADNYHMIALAVVEGLFGFVTDYPNGRVRVQPAFPPAWPAASIQTPDFSLSYHRDGDTDTYRLTLARAAEAEFRLPVNAERIRRVTFGGADVPWRCEAGFGCTWVWIRAPREKEGVAVIEIAKRFQAPSAVTVSGQVGDEAQLKVAHGKITGWQDFHGILEDAHRQGSVLRGRLARKPGHHLVLGEVQAGKLSYRQLFKVHIEDAKAEVERETRTPREAPTAATWTCLDLAPHYNGDIRTIFQQQYLSPRPRTCSVRLGVDGYSAWTFPYWRDQPPTIDLANVAKLDGGSGRIMTPQRAPFARFGEGTNIAFTSLWDNWPRSVTIPVRHGAEAVWLLVCGSTFPMQTRIANAEFRFRYADGVEEKLELVPPLNFWSLCPWGGTDYNYDLDAFCLPAQPPPTVQLGGNCRAMVLSWRLRPGATLEAVTLETLSQDVVIGLMGVSLMNPAIEGE